MGLSLGSYLKIRRKTDFMKERVEHEGNNIF